ncbi:MAG: hypothetical protein JJE52_14520 [Acidimicrobiia bacterium]|nr:hypothetical protein [Acidimicrobiia bacterium]
MPLTLRIPPWLAGIDRRALILGAALILVGYGPLVLLGPGTDLDVGGVYDAGRSILDGDYEVSRTPGAPVFEGVSGVLHSLGGTFAVNLVSTIMAVAAALAVVRLLDREGHPHAGWLGLAVLLNPFVWVAGTSMVDFMWAAALALVGANLQLSRRWVPAAVLYALAAGCRLSTLLLIGAFLLGDLLGAPRRDRLRLVALGAGVLAGSALVFLLPFRELGWDVIKSHVPSSTLVVQLGRFAVKTWYFFGPITVGLLVAVAPRLWRARGAWRTSAVLRMGVLGAVAVQLLFLRFPWKLAHLIPVFLCVLLVLGASRVLNRTLIGVLLAAQVVLGLVNVNLADPDRPDRATGGTFAPQIIEGPLLRDIRCRLDGDRDAYMGGDAGGEVGASLMDTWACVVPWSE